MTGHIIDMSKPTQRSKILSSGLAVFHKHGFHGSGIQEILDHAGVPKGSFCNHFKSKAALCLEVLDCYWEAGDPARLELQATGVAPLKRIDRHLAAYGYDKDGCLIGNFSAELSGIEEVRSRLSELHGLWITELAACIREGQSDGTIRDNDKASNLAGFVIDGLEGAKLKAKIDRDPGVVKRYRKTIQLFLQSRQVNSKNANTASRNKRLCS